ncbi:MAG: Holliday junction branch migration protein RuvA [Bacteroidales bacterium]|nr:Holliday junction branch migration protein RuvA [Bacteroidales bacterium]MDD2263404.1 Holliday junction branch migration protein RuvA [Bacteroidales bacterium]MDD2830806.1 Holliday junction branch migration protein RuvA [Bacteroidales bacterium]MDD3208005.1 Holliday junction branch migration protein RuvA [Bacteroidales bacterium]MDD3696488.1 Holliday junction branch migration protein RuvA [Bacteroidales bacterium]
MYEYIKGPLISADPAQAVVESGGIGYHILISLQTYSVIHAQSEVRLWLHLLVREDSHMLYGFATRDEREIFRLLIGVSGVGPNTARMILSAMSNVELRNALITGDVARIKSIKGIGTKTAERMIIELRDKMLKVGLESAGEDHAAQPVSEIGAEAAAALQQLGFQRSAVDKVISRLQKENPSCGLEDLIRQALKLL